MITEDYVSFETARLLKEKGFDCNTNCYYIEDFKDLYYSPIRQNHNKRIINNEFDIDINISSGKMSAPTLQMAMKWLREVYKLYITVVPFPLNFEHEDIQDGWGCEVTHLSDLSYDGNYEFFQKKYPIYEEACEAAIKYCLENLI